MKIIRQIFINKKTMNAIKRIKGRIP